MTLPRLRDNILALVAVQGLNFLIPLITLPFLARVLGASALGEVVLVQSVMGFLVLLVEFGFVFSATRQVSTHRHSREALTRLFSATWMAQWLLAGLAAGLLGLSVMLAQWLDHALVPTGLWVWGFGVVLGTVLCPIWLLQGLEALKAVAWLQALGRVLALPLLFWTVQGPADQDWALGFYSASSLGVGALSLAWVVRQGLVGWQWPRWRDVVRALRESALLFASRAAISLYTAAVPVALGVVVGPTALAFYSVADKVKQAIQALLVPVSQALYPRMSWLFVNDRPAAWALLRRTAWAVSGISALAGALAWATADRLVWFLGGPGFEPAVDILRWMAFIPCWIALSNLLGIQVMLPLGHSRWFARCVGLACMVSLLGMVPMMHWRGAVGAAQWMMAIEALVTLSMAWVLWRYSMVYEEK